MVKKRSRLFNKVARAIDKVTGKSSTNESNSERHIFTWTLFEGFSCQLVEGPKFHGGALSLHLFGETHPAEHREIVERVIKTFRRTTFFGLSRKTVIFYGGRLDFGLLTPTSQIVWEILARASLEHAN